MSGRALPLDRRTVLVGGGVGVGLLVAVAWWPRRGTGGGAGEGAQLGSLIRIDRDGRVTVAVPQVETGQGIWTALPQIAADELGAAWETVAVEPASIGEPFNNRALIDSGWLDGLGGFAGWRLGRSTLGRVTAGSTSIRAFAEPMREAGAAARGMLVAAAADLWQVDAAECEADGGFVRCGARSAGFGELAEAAAAMRVPARPARRRGSLIGRPLPRLDGPAKSDGSFRFAADVRLPGMLFASARLAPPGGRLVGDSRAVAARLPGVRAMVAGSDYLAALADQWWAAEQAMTLAAPRWSAHADDGVDLRTRFADALDSGTPDPWHTAGDYAAVAEGRRARTMTYWVAPALPLALEPPSVTARWSGGQLEVWAATLAPDAARAAAVRAAGKAADAVTLYPMPVGDSGGGALASLLIAPAIELAGRSRRPVQLTLPQAAAQIASGASGGAMARMFAVTSGDGVPAAWKMEVAAGGAVAAALHAAIGEAAPDGLGEADLAGAIPPYAIPDLAIDATRVAVPHRPAALRGSPHREMAFSTESFVDELARVAGSDPLPFRIAMLGGSPRLAHCLQRAAAAAGWDGGGRGSALGIAGWSAFGSHIALVAEAGIAPDQTVAVRRLVAAVDCGAVVNPALVLQQIEGGLIWALGLARSRAPEWLAGAPRARPVGALGLPRMNSWPEMIVEIVPSSAEPGGVSALAVPVLAPAVANAIYAATGRRLRALPFDLSDAP